MTETNNFKLHLEHPRTWKRRIARIQEHLGHDDPLMLRLNKAYSEWEGGGAIETPELLGKLEKLELAWLDSKKEVDSKIKIQSEHNRWKTTTLISFTALIATLISTSLNGYFQYKNYKLNESRISSTPSTPATPATPAHRIDNGAALSTDANAG
jgi:hypothetical protein